ncbi:hypothetical protein MA16_Dca003901 [Dendrobium catenatum]|uniref:Uncharacterized protein n=1 Tax=Dendrobium catenatum TaxID=906689 RepID=A0A2I0X1U8_9ASPA|nr:hypothetical protein MA16_Dca003901 [Dendrobium catenatum]
MKGKRLTVMRIEGSRPEFASGGDFRHSFAPVVLIARNRSNGEIRASGHLNPRIGFAGAVFKTGAKNRCENSHLLVASDVVVRIPGQCRYPDSPTVFLGLASAIAVVIAQATISIIAGCICCKRNANTSDTNWTVALISFVASWITFIIAFLLLLTGVALNDLKSVDQNNFDDYCYIVKPGVFSGGAIFSLASVSLGKVKLLTIMLYPKEQKGRRSKNEQRTNLVPDGSTKSCRNPTANGAAPVGSP